jgi:hypothetical protein
MVYKALMVMNFAANVKKMMNFCKSLISGHMKWVIGDFQI